MKLPPKKGLPQRPIDKILSKSKEVKKQGDGYLACCPAHDDTNPSLSIAEGRDGRVLLFCHAGCELTRILQALGLKTSDLFDEKKPKIIAEYHYQDAKGHENYEIVRIEPKGFYARRKVNGRYLRNLQGVKKEPYRLRQLNEAVENNKNILIVEGEKDCDNVADQLRLTATTFSFGLKWQSHYGEYFEGAKVVIIPDNDKPGIEKALNIAAQLKPIVKSLRLVMLPGLPNKGDISDWIEKGGTREQLIQLIKDTPPWRPPPVPEETEIEQNIREVVDKFNARYGTVMIKGKFFAIEPDCYDPSLKCLTIEYITPAALKQKYINDKVIVGYKKDSSPIIKDSASIWLESPHRRDYEGVVFDPGIDHGDKFFNIFRGFAFIPKKARIDLYLNHIFEVIANGDIKNYDHFIAIMADAVQLRDRPGICTAIVGAEGVGKGIVINNFGKLFGRHYVHITQGSHLTGRFNRHLTEASIVFVDEAFWAGDKQADGILKGMITEDRLMIEPKGCDAFPVKNHTRIFMASNNDWIVPAGMEARRYFVLRASDKHIQDRDYFGRIQKQMDNGGHSGLLRYLQQYNLDGIDLTAFPRTEELGNQKLLSLDAFERFWYSVLQNGQLFAIGSDSNEQKVHKRAWQNGVIAKKLLWLAFTDYFKNEGQKWYSGEEGFGMALKKMVPSREKKRIKSEMSYLLPPLQECRDLFDKMTQQKWDWLEVSDDNDSDVDDYYIDDIDDD